MEPHGQPNPDSEIAHEAGELENLNESRNEVEDLPDLGSSGERSSKPRWRPWKNPQRLWSVLVLVTYLLGLGSGFMLWGRNAESAKEPDQSDMQDMAAQINPGDGYQLPASYGNIGPRLLEAGAINLKEFVKLYQDMGKPLSDEQMKILTEGSSEPIVINQDNQHFLLNLFWAFGLANQNRILTEGPMMRDGQDGVVNFASTGGWSLSSLPVAKVYASTPIITFSKEQQNNLEEVALGVYRPCCNNPTHFPDCNHGMAMLGLLELMASQGASTDEMFEAAKYINAYWFPQQTLEVALAYKSLKNVDFKKASGREIAGQSLMSGSGFQAVHQWLVQGGKLEQAPQGGGSCGVK
jgi:hypothetical protein